MPARGNRTILSSVALAVNSFLPLWYFNTKRVLHGGIILALIIPTLLFLFEKEYIPSRHPLPTVRTDAHWAPLATGSGTTSQRGTTVDLLLSPSTICISVDIWYIVWHKSALMCGGRDKLLQKTRGERWNAQRERDWVCDIINALLSMPQIPGIILFCTVTNLCQCRLKEEFVSAVYETEYWRGVGKSAFERGRGKSGA